MSRIMTSMAGKGMRERMKMMQQVQSGMLASPNGLARQKVGTGKRLTSQERAWLKKQREKERLAVNESSAMARRAKAPSPVAVRTVAAHRSNFLAPVAVPG